MAARPSPDDESVIIPDDGEGVFHGESAVETIVRDDEADVIVDAGVSTAGPRTGSFDFALSW